MEKMELTDKRKLELIELIMTNDYEKAIGKELSSTEAELLNERQSHKNLSKAFCEICIMLIVLMIACYVLLCIRH